MQVRKCPLIFLAAILSFLSGTVIAQPAQCSHVRGSWTDNYNYVWQLSQVGSAVDGYVYVGASNPNCQPYWWVYGSNSNGQVNVTAYNPSAGMDYFCTDAFTYTGSIPGPGCSTGAGTWGNPSAQGSWKWSKTCDLPQSGETTHASQWYWSNLFGEPDSSAPYYLFGAHVANSGNGDLSGRKVREEEVGHLDGCNYPGSGLNDYHLTGLDETLYSANLYSDLVGWGSIAINEYRAANRAPCYAVANQRMEIACDELGFFGVSTDWVGYKEHDLVLYIGPSPQNQIAVERDEVLHPKTWP